jgi:hypothetical protein
LENWELSYNSGAGMIINTLEYKLKLNIKFLYKKFFSKFKNYFLKIVRTSAHGLFPALIQKLTSDEIFIHHRWNLSLNTFYAHVQQGLLSLYPHVHSSRFYYLLIIGWNLSSHSNSHICVFILTRPAEAMKID